MCGILYPEKNLFEAITQYSATTNHDPTAPLLQQDVLHVVDASPTSFFRQVSQGSRAQGTHGGGESAIKTRRGNS